MDSGEENNQPTQADCETKLSPPRDSEPDSVKPTPPDTTFMRPKSSSPQPATTSSAHSASSSVSPTLPPPALFVNALNLQPNSIGNADTTKKATEDEDSVEDDKMDAVHTATLTSKFKEDPNSVLKLLQAALPMEKLTSLIQSEHRADKKQLRSLQKQLEEAYVTLSECTGQKQELHQKIAESNEKIGVKRKQIEGLREELRVLGEEELQLKKKRDISYAKCSKIKKKLKCSREAQQQIAAFSAKTDSATNSMS